MKTCYLDANLLIFLGNENSPFNMKARNIINKLIKEGYDLLLSSLTLDEYFHSVLRFSEDSKNTTIDKLKKEYKKLIRLNIKLSNPPLEEKKHLQVINLIGKYNLHPRDAYHLFIMLENKIRYLATFDNDFEKVFELGTIKRFE